MGFPVIEVYGIQSVLFLDPRVYITTIQRPTISTTPHLYPIVLYRTHFYSMNKVQYVDYIPSPFV